MLFLLQAAADPVPGWIWPTIALSLLAIAAVLVGVSLALLATVRQARRGGEELGRSVQALRNDLAPTMQSVRKVAEHAEELALLVKTETIGVLHTSRRIRKKVDRGVQRVEERLEDLDALYEVVHDEVEDAALGLAATLRTVRHGRSLVERMLGRRRRRRR